MTKAECAEATAAAVPEGSAAVAVAVGSADLADPAAEE
jgi:hypothetical protein